MPYCFVEISAVFSSSPFFNAAQFSIKTKLTDKAAKPNKYDDESGN